MVNSPISLFIPQPAEPVQSFFDNQPWLKIDNANGQDNMQFVQAYRGPSGIASSNAVFGPVFTLRSDEEITFEILIPHITVTGSNFTAVYIEVGHPNGAFDSDYQIEALQNDGVVRYAQGNLTDASPSKYFNIRPPTATSTINNFRIRLRLLNTQGWDYPGLQLKMQGVTSENISPYSRVIMRRNIWRTDFLHASPNPSPTTLTDFYRLQMAPVAGSTFNEDQFNNNWDAIDSALGGLPNEQIFTPNTTVPGASNLNIYNGTGKANVHYIIRYNLMLFITGAAELGQPNITVVASGTSIPSGVQACRGIRSNVAQPAKISQYIAGLSLTVPCVPAGLSFPTQVVLQGEVNVQSLTDGTLTLTIKKGTSETVQVVLQADFSSVEVYEVAA